MTYCSRSYNSLALAVRNLEYCTRVNIPHGIAYGIRLWYALEMRIRWKSFMERERIEENNERILGEEREYNI